eukprot:scaffold18387_cov142-Cylindrotheca_fusiformis.AAC.2
MTGNLPTSSHHPAPLRKQHRATGGSEGQERTLKAIMVRSSDPHDCEWDASVFKRRNVTDVGSQLMSKMSLTQIGQNTNYAPDGVLHGTADILAHVDEPILSL